MLKRLVVLLGLFAVAHAAYAQDREKLIGIWKLLSFETEFQATGERKPNFGKNPNGFVIFTPEGRMMAVLTAEGRKAPETDEDRAALLRTMFAYTGIYRLEGDKFVTKRSEEHTSELQSRLHLVCRLLLEKKKKKTSITHI